MKYFLHLLTLILWTVCPPAAPAGTIRVAPGSAWASVHEAVSKACDGDTILIAKGLYLEHGITVSRPLALIGEPGAIIDAQGKGTILVVEAPGVTVRGLEFHNTGYSYVEDRSAIRIRKTDGFTISHNILKNTTFGIYLEYARHGTVFANHLAGKAVEEASSGNGIHLWYCKNIRLEKNHIIGHRDGIYLEFADSSHIKDNVAFQNLRYGLHFMFSNDDTYSGNRFSENGAGVAVMFSRRIHMWNNEFSRNWGKASYGLLLKEIYDLEISHNTFRENTIGILVEGSNRVNYLNNDFIRNGWAIKMTGGCLENTIRDNNFLSNTFDMAMHSSTTSNSLDGNYWDNYVGYDLDRDKTGDIPYRPVKLFNFIVHQSPESMILLRSLFIDLLNLAEKVSPVFTPENIADRKPRMRRVVHPAVPTIHLS